MATTWNPSDRSGNFPILSSGNLTATGNNFQGGVRGTAGPTSNKIYLETTWGGSGYVADPNSGCGIVTLAGNQAVWAGTGTNGIYVATNNGGVYYNNTGLAATLGAIASGNVIGFAVDLNNQRIWARINAGNWNASGTANPSTNAGGIDISAVFASIAPYACVSLNALNAALTANFGATAFTYTAPAGFVAWDAAPPPSGAFIIHGFP